MHPTSRTFACLVLGLCVPLATVPPAEAGPKKFLEAVDKAMKDYAADIQAEGDANINTIKTIGGKLLHPTKWKELPKDVDAGMRAYGDALTKTGDDALANSKAMFSLLLSVRTYIPDVILNAWDKAVAALQGAGGQVASANDSAWADDGAVPASGGNDAAGDAGAAGDNPFAEAPAAPAASDVPQASGLRPSRTSKPRRTLSVPERGRVLGEWIKMRAAAAGLVKMSRQARPEGKAKVASAMAGTVQSVRNQDQVMMRHLATNPKATSELVTLIERADRDRRSTMSDIVGQLNRIYINHARHHKATPEVKAAASALAGLKQKLSGK